MKWIKYTIHTTTEAEELVCAMLGENGIINVEIENSVPVLDGDKQGGFFAELQPDATEDDGTSRVSFYLEEDTDATKLLGVVRGELEDMRAYVHIGEGQITTEISDECDWRDNWKQFFSAFTIGNVYIKPTWEALPEDLGKKTLVEIDPGVSFGTGKHESTQLVIRQMEKYVKPQHFILDVGCGSGILSIVALKMGAAHVVGTDIDEDCIAASYENFAINHLSQERGEFYCGNLIDDGALQEKVGKERYDVVFANILADIIIPMAPMLENALKKDGYLITSGIIDFKEDEVKQALMDVGFEIVETNAQGEWRSVTAKKRLIKNEKGKDGICSRFLQNNL